MTKEDFNALIKKMDLLTKPYAVFVNPADNEIIEAALKQIDERKLYKVYEDECVEKGQVVLMDRNKLEEWKRPKIDFSHKFPWANNSFGYTCAHEMQKWALEIIDKYKAKSEE